MVKGPGITGESNRSRERKGNFFPDRVTVISQSPMGPSEEGKKKTQETQSMRKRMAENGENLIRALLLSNLPKWRGLGCACLKGERGRRKRNTEGRVQAS